MTAIKKMLHNIQSSNWKFFLVLSEAVIKKEMVIEEGFVFKIEGPQNFKLHWTKLKKNLNECGQLV